MEPNPDRGYGPNSNPEGGVWFHNHANERLRILGEIPLRKYNSDGSAVMDLEGNPDTSFLAKIPADAPFTFQTIDKNGAVLNASQTWHQVRPGELRNLWRLSFTQPAITRFPNHCRCQPRLCGLGPHAKNTSGESGHQRSSNHQRN